MCQSRNEAQQLLYGPSMIAASPREVRATLLMDERTEGWIGIPHGGIGMAAMVDLAEALENYPGREAALYPLTIDYRLGGASVKIGDYLDFAVSPTKDGACGEAVLDHNLDQPYLSATIRYGAENQEQNDAFLAILPKRIEDVLARHTPLPAYRKCFVCGGERNHPGLGRQFHLWDAPGKVVLSFAGFEARDKETFYRFHRNGSLHLLPLIALLDETLGWGGFMISASGAVTVRIGFTFHRSVSVKERLVFFGRGERLRGKPAGRLLFWASGGAAAVMEDGRLEMIASASGQYYGMQALTDQMKTALLPGHLTQKAFELAGPA